MKMQSAISDCNLEIDNIPLHTEGGDVRIGRFRCPKNHTNHGIEISLSKIKCKNRLSEKKMKEDCHDYFKTIKTL